MIMLLALLLKKCTMNYKVKRFFKCIIGLHHLQDKAQDLFTAFAKAGVEFQDLTLLSISYMYHIQPNQPGMLM